MSEVQISAAILAGLSLLFIGVRKWNNKDTRGARNVAALIFVLSLLLISVSGCTITPKYRPVMEIGAHYQPGERVYGDNPVGTVRLKQPVWSVESKCYAPRAWLEYVHHSSIPFNDDLAVTDQAGLMFAIPLGRSKE